MRIVLLKSSSEDGVNYLTFTTTDPLALDIPKGAEFELTLVTLPPIETPAPAPSPAPVEPAPSPAPTPEPAPAPRPQPGTPEHFATLGEVSLAIKTLLTQVRIEITNAKTDVLRTIANKLSE